MSRVIDSSLRLRQVKRDSSGDGCFRWMVLMNEMRLGRRMVDVIELRTSSAYAAFISISRVFRIDKVHQGSHLADNQHTADNHDTSVCCEKDQVLEGDKTGRSLGAAMSGFEPAGSAEMSFVGREARKMILSYHRASSPSASASSSASPSASCLMFYYYWRLQYAVKISSRRVSPLSVFPVSSLSPTRRAGAS